MKFIRAASFAFAVIGSFWVIGDTATAADFPDKLYLSQDGLALSQKPGKQVLRRTITVTRTSGNGGARWEASSDQSWLSVTPKGKKGGKLTVVANPEGLAPDQFYLANVTVSTNSRKFSDTEKLRVGFWINSINTANDIFLSDTNVSIATNPVLPLLYAVTANGKNIKAYNVYTGALVATFPKVGNVLGDLEVSSDGATLFAADMQKLKIVALDAASGAVLNSYDMGFPSYSSRTFTFAYARPYGQPALYIPGSAVACGCNLGQIMAYPSGEKLAGGFLYDVVQATPDGSLAVTMQSGVDPGSFRTYEIKLGADGLSLTETGWHETTEVNCQDIALSRDGAHVSMACGLPYELQVYDPRTGDEVQVFPLGPYPNNVEVDTFGNVIAGIDPATTEKKDTFIFDQNGFPHGTLNKFGAHWTAATKVSGDSTRIATISGPTVVLRNMP